VTISRDDVNTLSQGPGPGGVPLGAAEADRVAAVLNEHANDHWAPEPGEPSAPSATFELSDSSPPGGAAHAEQAGGAPQVSRDQIPAVMTRAGCTPEQIEEAAAALADQGGACDDHAVLAKFSLTPGELMERLGSSP
jgi:hypothetical protein